MPYLWSMMDSKTREQRSRNMAAIKSSSTLPEVYIRKILFSDGYRYRINQKNLPGKPDIVLAKYKTVIFIHGCFWHRHNCHLAVMPKSNLDYWFKKLEANVARDKRNYQALLSLGWKIILVWECAIKGKCRLAEAQLKSKILASIRCDYEQITEINSTASHQAPPSPSS